ncbi:hypothetical protein [Acidipropionibacterium virtanenii]|uniref:Uncharacterized protein n=1 Tax=Acidipropionibacterium virtanenii TaxID=2057246 RepID=A0A344US21_9ACTN|nr:hypothetical protein [Acidipropionibacterium virtanenii]AXE38069.1 hypothetical protein JS278_00882 [Acidipropionibacterium virtanenii]
MEEDPTLIGRPLPDAVKMLMRRVLSFTNEPEEICEQQIEDTIIETFAPDWINVITPTSTPQFRSAANPFLDYANVYRDGEMVGFILLWCDDRRLSAIEQAWVSDDPPEGWPGPDDVRFEPITLHP